MQNIRWHQLAQNQMQNIRWQQLAQKQMQNIRWQQVAQNQRFGPIFLGFNAKGSCQKHVQSNNNWCESSSLAYTLAYCYSRILNKAPLS